MPPVAPPHEHRVALLHPGAVLADEHAVARRVAQRVDRRLSHVRWVGLGISWLALTTVRSASPPKLVSKPQIRWFEGEHRVVVRRRILVVDVVAVHVTRSPGFQLRTADRPAARRPTRPSRHVVRQAWRAPTRLAAEPIEEPNVGSGSKIDVHTVLKLMLDAITASTPRQQRGSGVGTSSTWIDFVGSFSLEATPSKHVDLVTAHERRPIRLGDRQSADLIPEAPPSIAARICSIARCYSPVTSRINPFGHQTAANPGNSGDRNAVSSGFQFSRPSSTRWIVAGAHRLLAAQYGLVSNAQLIATRTEPDHDRSVDARAKTREVCPAYMRLVGATLPPGINVSNGDSCRVGESRR
jgi:hypothetical protein